VLKNLSRSKIDTIIATAETLNAKYPPRDMGIDYATHDPRPYRLDSLGLNKAVADLSDDERAELLALMWLGRGDQFTDFEDALSYAHEAANAGDVGYISDKAPALPKYLRAGLTKLSN
jgi:hypothetical protein